MTGCSVVDCDRDPARYRTMCEPHRHRLRKYGDPLATAPPRESTLVERITAKVLRGDDADCWPYTGATQEGYGVISDGAGVNLKAHRVAYETFTGITIPEDLTLDHECHNREYVQGACQGGPTCPHRRCCNPAHLVPREHQDNAQRGGALDALARANQQRQAMAGTR
jgi:hypothetical protein